MPVNGLVAVVIPLLEEAMHCGVSLSHWPAHQSLTGQLDSVSAIASSLLAGSLLVPCVITYSQLRVPFLFPAQLHSNRTPQLSMQPQPVLYSHAMKSVEAYLDIVYGASSIRARQ